MSATTRRRGPWLALAALLVAVALAAVAWWAMRPHGFTLVPRADQNVLLVTIDSLRADALSSYGGRAATPVLDGLAARGARFTFAHAHAVSTLPSHASVLTGRLPAGHGVRADDGYGLAPDVTPLALRLQAEGFATGAFVGSALLHRRRGLAGGFDVYDDRVGTPLDPIDLGIPERRADVVVRAALNWMGQQTSRWFTWVHLFDPHAPYDPPDAWRARYPSDPYLAEVAAADAALGALIERLAEDRRPTLVIVTSDHGEGLGQHGEETHGLFAYESTLRVPLIVSRIEPGDAGAPEGAGLLVNASAQLIDIVPTVLDAVGVAADASLPGTPLRVLLEGGIADRPVYFEALSPSIMRGWAPLRGVIADRQKFVDLPVPELYDLAGDAGELRNLAGIEPARAARLADTLRTFDVSAPGPPATASTAILERLRALGYMGAAAPPRERHTAADDPKRLVDHDRVMDAALVAFEQGRHEEAANALQQVIIGRPGNADAYRALAVVFWHAGLPDQAIATLHAALNAGLTQGGTRVMLAQMLARTDGAGGAIGLLEGLTGDDLDALSALGMAFSQVGRPAEAERAFRRMLEIDPRSGRAHENLGILQLRGEQYAEAEASLRRALSLDPGLSSAYTPLGVLLSDQNRMDEAIDAWSEAVRLDPGQHLALYNLTVALAALGREAEAREAGARFLRTAPPSLYAAQLAQIRSLLVGGAGS
jgi:arylsulfatase A-like enzyme/Flp pilus assembly protein TadD